MSVPVVDFRDWTDDTRRAAFVQALGEGLERYGFVSIRHSGIDPALIERCYATAARVFAQPAAIKRKYEDVEGGRQRGYTSFGIEHAKDQEQPDLKEFWHIGRDLVSDHPLAATGRIPRNLYIEEVPAFERDFAALFRAQDSFMHALLAAVGEFLCLPKGFFGRAIRDGNSVVRAIYYPPLGRDASAGAVRAAQHEDINLMTSLPVSTAAGLELLTREGEWMAVETPPGVMVCDTGDMMAMLTNGRLPATTHRVVNPAGALGRQPRYSMPFFCHPHPDFELKAATERAPAVTAGSFLHQRLIEIGVG
jgi:isopenicillin N synthase-like dioxygenase